MASYTPNLNLLKKDPVADGNDKFNIETMLNQNWNAIDAAMGNTTAPAQKLGLTGDLSVGASLGVLANIGNLHVWKRTVVHSTEIPAGYELGAKTGVLLAPTAHGQVVVALRSSGSISVNDSGTISMSGNSSASYEVGDWTMQTGYTNTFIKITRIGSTDKPDSDVYYLSGACRFSNNGGLYATEAQLVIPHPKTPASTVVDYVCSVDRNAYQDGTVGNTTYEYVGVVGDKARVQVLSYVGTGTYGSSQKNSLTFDFVPKLVVITRKENVEEPPRQMIWVGGSTHAYTDHYVENSSYYGETYNIVSFSGTTMSWYNSKGMVYQMNRGFEYRVVAFG